MRVRSVSVGSDSVEAVVEFDAGEPLRTSQVDSARERALAVLPGLAGHRCENEDGRSFASELADTELAHVLEHAALEVMALAGSPDTLRGSTAWDFPADGRGVFRVTLQYDHDLVAIGAVTMAEAVVRWLSEGGEAPDPAAEGRRLAGLRRR